MDVKPVDLLLVASAALAAGAVGVWSLIPGLLVGAVLAAGLWFLLDEVG